MWGGLTGYQDVNRDSSVVLKCFEVRFKMQLKLL